MKKKQLFQYKELKKVNFKKFEKEIIVKMMGLQIIKKSKNNKDLFEPHK